MKQYNWSEIKVEQLNPLTTRQAIHSGNMTVARLELKKDAAVAEHHHHNEQITMVDRGALQFTIGGGEKVVRTGDSLVIPPHMPHAVVALEDSTVFDIF